MTNSIDDLGEADVVLVIGSNTTEAHPIIGIEMKQAALRGAKLIVVDPRRTELAEHAHLWLRLKPGTDVALLNAMMRVILDEGLADKEFIAERTEGFDDLWETVDDYPAERAAEITGVPRPTSARRRDRLRPPPSAGIFYSMGITQHTVRHRQRHDRRQPGAAHRQHRPAGHRREPAARPEQRAGRLRHGRAAQLVPGLPERQ